MLSSLETHVKRLPDDFLFGVATSSYQIEGSNFGGCGLSHWHEFAKKSGRVYLIKTMALSPVIIIIYGKQI